MERMIQVGVRPMTSLQYLLELQRDRARGETCIETVATSVTRRRLWTGPDLRQDHVQEQRRAPRDQAELTLSPAGSKLMLRRLS